MKKRSIKHNQPSSIKRVKKRQFLRNFSYENLKKVFDERIYSKNDAGIDGIHPHDLKQKETFEIINRKVYAGTYNFTPYAEIQSPKGRGKLPRIIALPVVRDQIVLSALKDYLHEVFPDNVNRTLPNSYIFKLNKEIHIIRKKKLSYMFIQADISGFYDNIDREKLMNFVRSKINIPETLKLIYRAIANPIVPRNSKRRQRFRYYSPKGVPQGLAVSNILASIYMLKFDKVIESISQYYIRYVDDILILCPNKDISPIMERFHHELSKLGLELNKEKTNTGVLNKDSFDYLGYKLKSNGRIGVRDSSVHRKITSLAGKISSADHRKDEFLKLHDDVDKRTYREVLVEDINEQITGALGSRKRYGWLFYFLQINDMALLHRLDRIVEKLCRRCRTFLKRKPQKVKSFVTAFREIHKLQTGIESPYIPNYDDWKKEKKEKFLRDRGQLLKKKYTGSEINRRFKTFIYKRLLSLEKDVRNIS